MPHRDTPGRAEDGEEEQLADHPVDRGTDDRLPRDIGGDAAHLSFHAHQAVLPPSVSANQSAI